MEWSAALWSAVAASFSAASSLFVMQIQRRNFHESVRPELVLLDWTREARGEGNGAHELVRFRRVKNVGRGAAFHIYVGQSGKIREGDLPLSWVSTRNASILAPGEEHEIGGEITLWWKNVGDKGPAGPFIAVPLYVLSWDRVGRRHQTKYQLFAIPVSPTQQLSNELAPCLSLSQRHTVTRAVWTLRMQTRLAKLPGLSRLAKGLSL